MWAIDSLEKDKIFINIQINLIVFMNLFDKIEEKILT